MILRQRGEKPQAFEREWVSPQEADFDFFQSELRKAVESGESPWFDRSRNSRLIENTIEELSGRIASACRTTCSSRAGPVRISGDDRRLGELVERLPDRFADLVADPGNRRLHVAERGQAVGQHEKPGA